MSVVRQPSRPDLEAFHLSMTMPFRFVVKQLIDQLGAKLVAYIGGVSEVRAAKEWADDRVPKDPTVERKLRFALRVTLLIIERDSRAVAQAWFQGLNPQLGDRVPAQLLRDGDIEEVGPEVVAAARAFVVGG